MSQSQSSSKAKPRPHTAPARSRTDSQNESLEILASRQKFLDAVAKHDSRCAHEVSATASDKTHDSHKTDDDNAHNQNGAATADTGERSLETSNGNNTTDDTSHVTLTNLLTERFQSQRFTDDPHRSGDEARDSIATSQTSHALGLETEPKSAAALVSSQQDQQETRGNSYSGSETTNDDDDVDDEQNTGVIITNGALKPTLRTAPSDSSIKTKKKVQFQEELVSSDQEAHGNHQLIVNGHTTDSQNEEDTLATDRSAARF